MISGPERGSGECARDAADGRSTPDDPPGSGIIGQRKPAPAGELTRTGAPLPAPAHRFDPAPGRRSVRDPRQARVVAGRGTEAHRAQPARIVVDAAALERVCD